MKLFKADLHIHTVLSPCGSLEMSPKVIVESALSKGIDIIGITDHNSTLQCTEVVRLANKNGLAVLCGAEVTTKEEVHCLTFFENFEKLETFQHYLDQFLPNIPNDTEMFGHQVWVDEDENILGEEKRLLISAIDQSIDEVEAKVRSLDGLFIPAHVDRGRFSLYSQLGFMPFDLKPDAVGMTYRAEVDKMIDLHPELKELTILRSSDAHFPNAIGEHYTVFELEEGSFQEVRMALHQKNNRKVIELV
ncbi:PHP domain-containing protein [Carboxylicivirga linearis]|uniref:PHP domain-containing protein n=1 Tax=Carboxylicivirga linearis TaxID=1628157 RepID=A0ABS5K0T7_9BACT|nr:PHP domain-containing protein [Carboxylicivirga linearis]MBS2100166.1 PHP domain-containing protein [Carboxylicivirga linearis]